MTIAVTSAGQTLSAVVPCHGSPPPRPERVPVLVEIASDGFLRIHAPENVDVRIVHRLTTTTPENATLDEERLSRRLPQRHREVYWADHVRAVYMPRTLTAKEVLQCRLNLDWLHLLQDATREDGR